MSIKVVLLLAGLSGLVGVVFGYFLRWIVSLGKRGSMEIEIKQMLLGAREQAQKITSEAEVRAQALGNEVKENNKIKGGEIRRSEDRLIKKEALLDKRQGDIERDVEHLKKKVEEVREIKQQSETFAASQKEELERIAGLSKESARDLLLQRAETDFEEDMVVRLRKLEAFGLERIERRAKEILTTAIHRLGNSVAAEVMATTVILPSDDVKGKIIGKEGRNIKAFERASGVEVIVDDTPGVITISCFDPVRRHIARLALENLIIDGRIQPAKIEEMVEKAKQDVNKTIKEKGEQAAYECGVFNLDPRLLGIVGRLHFRTSYGQNVLQHSIEMAHIAGMLAEELGGNVSVAKAGALLHDIGKAVDHEVQGTHVAIGRRILQKFNVDEAIIKAMQSHHEEYPYETVESVIVQVADAISGGRPGARRDTVENYLKRLSELEEIADSFEGVEKSFALQAGREVRIFVQPENISELAARNLAREMARRIESELKYPGEIKITVIRETRVTEYAR
jgi:ribonucrease Y